MLIELLSMSNYVSYNIKVAKLLGLHSAIYISELLSINDKAIRKKKLDNESFKLDREYIQSRTTLTTKEQLDIEKNLIELGLLKKDGDNITLQVNVLTTLLMAEDEELKSVITPIKKSRMSKDDKIKDNLKLSIATTNEELRTAYFSWIDTVYTKQGWLSKKAVEDAQKLIDEFTHRDLDMALHIIGIADKNGYRDMSWAINKFKNESSLSYMVLPTHQPKHPVETKVELSSEEF